MIAIHARGRDARDCGQGLAFLQLTTLIVAFAIVVSAAGRLRVALVKC